MKIGSQKSRRFMKDEFAKVKLSRKKLLSLSIGDKIKLSHINHINKVNDCFQLIRKRHEFPQLGFDANLLNKQLTMMNNLKIGDKINSNLFDQMEGVLLNGLGAIMDYGDGED